MTKAYYQAPRIY